MMQKILKLLEQNVQWGTLAIGAAFLGFMIWSYVFVNPAAKSLTTGGATQIAAPGAVDRLILDGSAAQLDQKVHTDNSGFQIPMPSAPAFPVDNPTTQPLPAVEMAWDSWPLDLSKLGASGPSQIANIQGLPVLPALSYLDNEPLRTLLAVTDAAGNATTRDQDSVTTFWSLPIANLIAAYQTPFALKLPPSQQRVYFAHADLVRQEQLPDGTWGDETVVTGRIFNEASPPRPAYPDPANPQFAATASEYHDWLIVAHNQRSIVNADFPAVSAQALTHPELQWQPLDAWVAFRAKQQAEANAPIPAPTPTTPVAPPVTRPPNPAQRNPGAVGGSFNPTPQVQPLMQQQQFQQQQNPYIPSGPTVYGRGGRIISTGNGTVTLRSGNGQPQVFVPVTAPPQPITPVQPPAAQPIFGSAPTTVPAVNATPAAPPVEVKVPVLPPLQLVPNVDFTLTAIQTGGDIELYFHDPTVEDGKTYRYKVRYSLLNPVYNQPNEVANAALAKVFAIDSPDSGWSDPIAVPPRTKFWCSAKQLGAKNGTVAFSVFSWHNGKWDEKDFPDVAPGDEIGDGDFVTHWTLLDTRTPRIGLSRLALIVSDNGGAAQVRNTQADAASHEFQRMMLDFQAQNAATAGAPGAPPPAAGGG
jgi:hypothetical protein